VNRQNIDFEGLVNCRDLGGLTLENSGVTRNGVFFRSETPQLMTEADLKRARNEFGIGRVVDLRGKKFLGKDLLDGSGPLGDDGRGVRMDFFELAGGIENIDPSPDGFLRHLLNGGEKPLEVFLEHFVNTDKAVLVHCHTGKDRTGFIVAATLALAGVTDAEIVTDYEMSGPPYDPMMANLDAFGLGVPPHAPAYALHRPSRAAIVTMLERVRDEWGSAQAWASAKGIDRNLIARARARLVP
jgi:protein-tyrosine phosphatase